MTTMATTAPHALSTVLWFLALLACVPLALWLRQRNRAPGLAQGAGLRRVAVLPLSPSQRLVTVEVGSGAERRWLVLGVTPQSITTLHAMAPQADAAAGGGGAPAMPPSFGQLLGRWKTAP